MNSLFDKAKAKSANLENQNEQTAGGDFDNTPPAGKTPARFIGYVDIGMRKQRAFQGKEKPDAPEVMLFFELNGSKHTREVEVDGEKKTFTNVIRVRLTKKHNEKAGYSKLYNKMKYGRGDEITHMSQMLGEGFLIDVVHNEVEKEGKKRVYANMKDGEGNWLISAPMIQRYNDMGEPDGDPVPVPVPEPAQPGKLLLWEDPDKEMWDSIFIDGTRTVKDDKGNEREVSKNWLQEDIVQNAVNFEGSPLQALLGGLADLTLEGEPETPAETSEPETKEQAAEKQPGDAPSDPLAALGL